MDEKSGESTREQETGAGIGKSESQKTLHGWQTETVEREGEPLQILEILWKNFSPFFRKKIIFFSQSSTFLELREF